MFTRRKWAIIRPRCTKPQGNDITVISTAPSLPPSSLAPRKERLGGGEGGREDLEIKWIVPSLLRAKERRVITTDRVLTRGKKLFLLFPPPVLLCDCGRRSARVVVLSKTWDGASSLLDPPYYQSRRTRRLSGRFDTAESAKIKCLTALIVPRRLWGNIILRVCPTNDNDTIGRREVCCRLSYPVSIEISSSSSFFLFL